MKKLILGLAWQAMGLFGILCVFARRRSIIGHTTGYPVSGAICWEQV